MRRFDRARWVGRGGSVAMVLSTALMITGCGGSAPEPESSPSSAAASEQSVAAAQPGPGERTPAAVVSEFLDGVRRGGTAADIGRLMTKTARQQYAAVGLVMQPIGAPDAKFEITRSEPFTDGAVLVNSLWTEQLSEGEPVTYQVAWALKKEPEGWRVSGLILDEQPEPRAFNFESREDVLAIKRMQEGEPAGETDPTRTAEGSGFEMPSLK